MGGTERVERQHASGRLTVRERIERLFDPGTFHETGALAGRGELRRRRRARGLPARQRGRGPGAHRRPPRRRSRATTSPCAAAPPTRRSGRRRVYAERLAHDLRIPLVRLVDGTGGGGQRQDARGHGLLLRAAAARASTWWCATWRSCPVATAALGPVAGLGAARVVCSHFSVIVRGTAQLFVAGPPVVAAAHGRGARQGGARAARACRPAPARWTTWPPTRTTRSPSSGASSPTSRRASGRRRPLVADADPPDRREEELLSIVPRDRRQPYKMRRILDAVFDRGSVFELGAAFGRPVITALARLGGRPVGVLASDPSTTAAGSPRTPRRSSPASWTPATSSTSRS